MESDALQFEELNDIADDCKLDLEYFAIKKDATSYTSKRAYLIALLEQAISIIGKENFDIYVRGKTK